MDTVPALVTLTLWGVAPSRVPAATTRMGLDQRHLRRTPGLRFAKMLTTTECQSVTIRNGELAHWGLLAVWDDEPSALAFATGTTHQRWAALSQERLDLDLRPLACRGSWARQSPFGDPPPRQVPGPVAAITRARVRSAPVTGGRWSAPVPPLGVDRRQSSGLLLAVGIAEAPIGLLGTFSLWESAAALADFAHRRQPHSEAIALTTGDHGWYAEELFARFEVTRADGTFAGHRPLSVASRPAVRSAAPAAR